MNQKTIILGAGAILIIVVGLFVFSNNQIPKPSLPATTNTEPTPAVTDTTPQTSDIKEFIVTGQNYLFSPSTITVKQGDTVKITFKNIGGMHDFKIDEFNAATKKINTGAEEIIQFVADKTGSFEYYCSVGSHRAMGMKGTLIVE